MQLAAIIVLLAAVTSPTPAAAAAACADFTTQQAAQQAANTSDPDHDGIYCESLPCPCSPEWHAQHNTKPPPPPPPPPRWPPSSPNPIPGTTNAPAPGTVRSRVSPLRDPRGLHPGLTRIAKSRLTAARRLIRKVRIARLGTKTGYARSEFGAAWTDTAERIPWAGNRCDTRDDILRRDLTRIQVRVGTHDCVIESGRLRNPYLGNAIRFRKTHATLVQIDHVIPLSLAWQMGAAQWTATKRVQLANDPLNLLAVDSSSNGSKGDSSPAEWLPANARIRCAYSVRVTRVALRYDLPVTRADRRTMLAQCRSAR